MSNPDLDLGINPRHLLELFMETMEKPNQDDPGATSLTGLEL